MQIENSELLPYISLKMAFSKVVKKKVSVGEHGSVPLLMEM